MWLSLFDVADDLKNVDLLLGGDHITRVGQSYVAITRRHAVPV